MIRRAARRDIPQIIGVIEAAFAQYEPIIPPAIFASYLDDMRAIGSRWDEAEVLVVERHGRVAGSVAFYADASLEGLGLPAEWAGLRTLAVHPEARGRGIGRQLSQQCLEMARARGAPVFGLHTAGFMTAACRLYETLGFRRAPELDLRASAILGLADDEGDIDVIAYVRELLPPTESFPSGEG